MFLVDGSSSMLNDWSGSISRFHAAGNIITAITDSIIRINPDAEFAVRVFGHQHPAQEKNCYDTRLEVTFKKQNSGQIKARMNAINPMGYSPIAWSLQQTALEDFDESKKYAYSIILVTDGGESCGGDICATMQKLLADKISFKPYILSLIDYAPLKAQYDCLGTFITVADEQQVAPAIKQILDDNRPVITMTGLPKPIDLPKPAPVVDTVKPAPPITKIPVKPTVTAANVIAGSTSKTFHISPVLIAAKKIKVPSLPKINIPLQQEAQVATPVVNTPVPAPPPAKPTLVKTPIIVSTKKVVAPNVPHIVITLRTAPVRPLPSIKIEPEIIAPPLPKITPVKAIATHGELTQFNFLYSLANGVPLRIAHLPLIKNLVAPEPAPVPVPPTPKPPPNVVNNTPQTQPPPIVTAKDADRTTLAVYFTNGKGKYYSTEPDMIISDSKTGKQVKRQMRTVDYNGVPEPIELPSGNYNINFPGSTNKASNVFVNADKENKVEIVVNNGTLAFQYSTNPDRPVKEYTAYVSKRFEDRINTKQICDTTLPYEPANYHIEINTLPPMLLNSDVSFGSVTVISIKEPGTIKITNTENIGRIQFWRPLGDQYVPFYEMNILGDVNNQVAHFLPGPYELRYVKPSGGPVRQVTPVKFQIKSNETVEIKLDP